MPSFIVHHDGYFFEWSTVSDGPTTHAMTREEFEAYYREEYGREGLATLPDRFARAIKTGTSARDGMSARDLVFGNRAGTREGELPFKKVIELVHSWRTP